VLIRNCVYSTTPTIEPPSEVKHMRIGFLRWLALQIRDRSKRLVVRCGCMWLIRAFQLKTAKKFRYFSLVDLLPVNTYSLCPFNRVGSVAIMSGLEIVASIAGVAAAAIKVSVSMNDLAEEIGSAGRDVQYIGNEMAGFAQVTVCSP